MSSGDQEALNLADECANFDASIYRDVAHANAGMLAKLQDAADEIRRLLAEREADREAMDDALNALVAVRAAVPDLHEYGNLAGNTLGSRVDAAISSLKARMQ